MKLHHISPALIVTLGMLSCERPKKETQTSIQDKAKASLSQQQTAQPKTGLPMAEAARQVGHKNDDRARKSNELLEKAKKQ